MRDTSWPTQRAGSLAARPKYANDAYFDLEQVRAFAMRHACTYP